MVQTSASYRYGTGRQEDAQFFFDELWDELPQVQGRPDWITWDPSPYHSDRNGSAVTAIIYHYTVTPDLAWTVRYFKNNDRHVSAHYVIGRDGRIVQMVPLERAANHAGPSTLPGHPKGVNSCSVGIEIVNWGELQRKPDGSFNTAAGSKYAGPPPVPVAGRYWEPFTDAQYAALISLTRYLLQGKPAVTHITGHEDVSPGRKTDPGPAFDWGRIATGLRPVFAHHIGRIVQPSSTHPTPRVSVVEDRRVAANRGLAQTVGWRSYVDVIAKLLGFTDRTPDERAFADALARWQGANGLQADGILGAGTWRTMQQRLRVQIPSSSEQKVTFFKDSPRLLYAPLGLAIPVVQDKRWAADMKRASVTHNRLGGLMRAVADETKTEVPAVLAVWQIESGGFPHVPGKAVIRFENHQLFQNWGKFHEEIYSSHFRHGGHRGVQGKAWQNHQFRESTDGGFVCQRDKNLTFQQNQEREYAALRVATNKAGPEPALLSMSIGGPQIMMSNFKLLGYGSPREMYDAFQGDERFHVLGFFDFCNRRRDNGGNLLDYLRSRDWSSFARLYNGPGQVEWYAAKLQEAYQSAKTVTA